MSRSTLFAAIVTAVAAVASFNVSAIAATAHNIETGAGTSNSYDTALSAAAKQR